MLKKRIIPCLDVKNGRIVKGVNFLNLKDAGNPITLAEFYTNEIADELVFLDITATIEKRKIFFNLIQKIAEKINIPFTVGGGISSLKDVQLLIESGADKISINSFAIKNPKLITEIAKEFGTQCIVVAIDINYIDNYWKIFINGGRVQIKLNLFDWVKQVEDLGAGEILLTSMMHDGKKSGFSIDILHEVSQLINIPVIASGGAGTLDHFKEVFRQTRVTGALAASVFHFGEISIKKLKIYLKKNNINVRI